MIEIKSSLVDDQQCFCINDNNNPSINQQWTTLSSSSSTLLLKTTSPEWSTGNHFNYLILQQLNTSPTLNLN